MPYELDTCARAPRRWLFVVPAVVAFAAFVPSKAKAARVVYVNTGPVTVEAGASNDPSTDTINVNGFTTTEMDGWVGATPEQLEELVVMLKDTSVEFDIVFTAERPQEGPYDMIVFGSAEDHAAGFGGTCSTQVGLSDCMDSSGASIAFSYWGCLDEAEQLNTERVAFHTLGGLGYGWGLENISGTGQLMSGWSGTALKWGDACANLSGASSCAHADCAMGQQNSSADLLANIGARVDDGPPVLTVVEPQPGSDVEAPFDVVIEIDDAFGGLSAQIEIVDAGAEPVPDTTWPYRWDDLGLPDGPLTLRITAFDADGNEVSQDVPICVGGGCPDTGEEGGTEGESGEGDNADDTDATDFSDEADAGDTLAGDDEDGGGGCSVDAGQTGAAAGFGGLGLLLLLGLGRRRD